MTVGTQRYPGPCNLWPIFTPHKLPPNLRSRRFGKSQSPNKCSRLANSTNRLIKRATIVGRLFYHTAMTLLAQTNPLMSKETEEMNSLKMSHAHQICGIVAHVKDRGVASVAIRSLAIAAECLVVRREQEEVLEIFEKIRKETGWNVRFLNTELRAKWGWASEENSATQQMAALPAASLGQFFATSQAPVTNLPPAPTMPPRNVPSGILNPLLKSADFSLPNHPYQQYYMPPSQQPPPQFSHNWT